MNVQEAYEKGQFQEVIATLEKNPDVDHQVILAFCYQKTKQWEKAMECWNSLIVQFPSKAEFYNERGVCKFNLRFKHAIQDFDKAIELEPSNAYYYSCRAYIKDKTGDTEGSVKDYTKSLELDPEDAIILNNLGLAEQKLGHTAKARAQFKKSDQVLGIETIDSREEANNRAGQSLTPQRATLWSELKKMVSSKQGFMDFLKELTNP